MNHLVFLDAEARELEKILSGIKSIIISDNDPLHANQVSPGDSLFFLRNNGERTVRVKARVVQAWTVHASPGEDLADCLKGMQTRLQCTEDQYNHWSLKTEAFFVEFENAHKIHVFHVAPDKIKDQNRWISFEDVSLLQQEEY